MSPLRRHRTVTAAVIAARLQCFQPGPNGATGLIDRGGSGYRPLTVAGINLDEADPEMREPRLQPGPEHQRPYLPTPWGGSRLGWDHGTADHGTLRTAFDQDPLIGMTGGEPAGRMVPAAVGWVLG
jgi:hypothetical protein